MNTKTGQFKLTTPTASILFVCALLIGAMQGTAEANVCKKTRVKAPCVDSRDVSPNSLTGITIVDNSLTAADQADEAGADFASGEQVVNNVGSNLIVRSVTITAPTAGQVIVNASGVFDFDDNAAVESMTCSITTDAFVDFSHEIAGTEGAPNSGERMPFAGTRGFLVAAGSTTFNLVCTTGSGTMDVIDTSLTAIFVPTAY
jgi:hypothetical protein